MTRAERKQARERQELQDYRELRRLMKPLLAEWFRCDGANELVLTYGDACRVYNLLARPS